MSTISNISSSGLYQPFATNTTYDTGTSGVSSRQPLPPPPSDDGIMSAVQEALGQMGLSINLSSGTDSSSNTSSIETTGTTSDDASAARKALFKFMHDLFTAMQEQASKTSNSTAYSFPMTTSIQDVLQALGDSSTISSNTSSSGTASPQSTDLRILQSDFQNLVSSLGGTTSGNSQSVNLQTFLQNLLQNLSPRQSYSAGTGTFINTTT